MNVSRKEVFPSFSMAIHILLGPCFALTGISEYILRSPYREVHYYVKYIARQAYLCFQASLAREPVRTKASCVLKRYF